MAGTANQDRVIFSSPPPSASQAMNVHTVRSMCYAVHCCASAILPLDSHNVYVLYSRWDFDLLRGVEH